MRVRTLVMGALLTALLTAQPNVARAQNGAAEAGMALGAAALNVVYTPCKAIVALGGLFAGGVVGFLTGGDTRAAYALWVPAASGTYLVRPANLDGSEPLEFFGTDYADRASPMARSLQNSSIYEALYK
jgi:hypothetical protein